MGRTEPVSASRRMARWVTAPVTLSDSVREEVSKAFVDTLGCALAGWFEPASRKIRAAAGPAPSSDERGASAWGADREGFPETIALLNGTAAHALDYDDLVLEVTAHPSGALVAAALAGGEHVDASGREVIRAYARGLEALVRVGQGLGFHHYKLGWHATSTLGTLGTAVTAGSLLDLNEEAMIHALGIAASMASGLQVNFGSMVKPLHMGLAARGGVRAARLAGEGFEADEDALGEKGFARAFTGGAVESLDGVVLGDPLFLEESGLARKKYPCCYATHRMIEGALGLREEGVTDPGTIHHLTVTTPPGGLAPLREDPPKTASEAKFSGEYCVLTALLDGRVDLSRFTEEAVGREPIRRHLDRVRLREESGEPSSDASLADGVVTLSLERTDGSTLTREVEDVPGSPADPMTPGELRRKFRGCFEVFEANSDGVGSDPETLFDRWGLLDEADSVRGLLDETLPFGEG